MTELVRYDIAVIGAGIGGYVSAIKSAQLGKRVVLIEKDRVGGTCLNRGCIPTKTLLATVAFLGMLERSEEFGVQLGTIAVDFQKVMARKDAVVNRLVEGVQFLIGKNKVQLVNGKGTVLSRNRIKVSKPDGNEEAIDADNIIIATGSEEPKPSYAEIDEERILSTAAALSLNGRPESLAVIGGDVMGIEFAVIFKALGAEVKVFEAGSNLLPKLDIDIGRNYQRILKKKGIEVYLDAEVRTLKDKPSGKVAINVVVRGSHLEFETEKALVTDRRRPSSKDLGLEEIGVQVKEGFVVVDEHQRTSVPNIYAVGDVTGGKMLAHVAAAQGIVAAENIAGLRSTFDPKTVPTCMYSQPEVASVGLSEEEAGERGYEVAVGKFPLLASGRALSFGETDGFAKVVCDRETGEILGVHLIAPHAADVIGEAALAMRLECTSEELGALVHAHPSIGEALMEAAKAVKGKAIHI